ncbi:hypothetical protein PC39_14607 [Salinisphaera sp. PC39]|uniref:hypothetical protein n=1 Tax=Salinisphaera sp. PC39 TaxID=1304156 RepID=UPI003341AC10
MTEFIATIIVFAVVMVLLSIGVMVRGVHIKGSCGGMNNLKKALGFTPCDACKDPGPNCHRRERSAM